MNSTTQTRTTKPFSGIHHLGRQNLLIFFFLISIPFHSFSQQWKKVKPDKLITTKEGEDDKDKDKDKDKNKSKEDSTFIKVAINISDTSQIKEALEVGGNAHIRGRLICDSSTTVEGTLEITGGGGTFILQPNQTSPAPAHDNLIATTRYFTVMGGGRRGTSFYTTPDIKMAVGMENAYSKLQLYDSTEVFTQYTNTTTNNTATDGLKIGIATNGTAEIRHQENFPLIFYTGNTERARIDQYGRMGIGYANPAALLHIGGNAIVDSTLTVNEVKSEKVKSEKLEVNGTTTLNNTTIHGNTTVDSLLTARQVYTHFATIDSGIKITAPLHVESSETWSDNNWLVALKTPVKSIWQNIPNKWNRSMATGANDWSTGGAYYWMVVPKDTLNGAEPFYPMRLVVGNGLNANLLLYGTLGIGTSTPTGKFHVANDSVGFDSSFVIRKTGATGIGVELPEAKLHIRTNSDTAGYALKIQDAGGNNLFSVQNNGSIVTKGGNNIGNNSYLTGKTKLDSVQVTGTVKIGNSIVLSGQQQPGGGNTVYTDDGPLYIQSNTSYNHPTVFHAGNSGKLAIGNTSPLAKVHISQTDGFLNYASPGGITHTVSNFLAEQIVNGTSSEATLSPSLFFTALNTVHPSNTVINGLTSIVVVPAGNTANMTNLQIRGGRMVANYR